MTNPTFSALEAAQQALWQYRNDLQFPPVGDSVERRLEEATAASKQVDAAMLAFADAPRPTSAPVVGEREAIARIIREHHRTHVRYPKRTNEPRKTFHQGDLEAADAILAREQAASPPSEVLEAPGLLSHLHAVEAGKAMHARWSMMADEPPPMDKEDAGWADLFRAGYERLRPMIAEHDATKGGR